MKRILISMMTIALVSALVAGGIYAGFFDTEEGDIEFRAGTIDLTVDGKSETWTLAVTGLVLGAEGQEDPFKLRNIGSIAGKLSIAFSDATATEVRGTRGMATHTAENDYTLKDTLLIDGGADHWVGYYLTLYTEDPVDTETPKRVIAFNSATGVLTIDGSFDSGTVSAGQKYALQTEHERPNEDHEELTEGFLEVAFKVGPDKFLNPATTGYVSSLEDAWGNISDFADKDYEDFIEIGANETIDFTAYWKTALGLLEHANPYQGAGVAVPVEFTLNQVVPD